MSFGKVLGIGIITYALLNFVFMIIFVGVGGLAPDIKDIGEFFTKGVSGDTFGTISAIFSPGGGSITTLADPISNVFIWIEFMILGGSVSIGVVGMLWSIIPGLVAGILAGLKGAEDNSKSAFFGVVVAILIATLIPMIFGIAGQLTPNLTLGHYMTFYMVSSMYYALTGTAAYVAPVIVGIFGGCIYGGIAAASSSNL